MPDPDAAAVAAFNALADRAYSAGLTGRFAQGAELSLRAAAEAERLYGGSSVIAAELLCCAAKCLHNRACFEGVEDPVSYSRSALEALLRAIGHLAPRLSDGTLRAGACRAEEAAFWTGVVLEHATRARLRLGNTPSGGAATASACGYITAVIAATVVLNVLVVLQWPERLHADQDTAQRFVQDVLAFMEAAAPSEPRMLQCEVHLAAMIEELPLQRVEPAFSQALFARWRGAPLVAVRRRRQLLLPAGVMSIAAQMTLDDEAERRAADIAKRGLRECALPGCGAVETSVKEFKLCGACRAAAYCCADHAAAHWKLKPDGHKAACKQSQAASADTEQ
jgi:hypothetical protein